MLVVASMIKVKLDMSVIFICLIIMVNLIGKTHPQTSLHLGHLYTTTSLEQGSEDTSTSSSTTWQNYQQDGSSITMNTHKYPTYNYPFSTEDIKSLDTTIIAPTNTQKSSGSSSSSSTANQSASSGERFFAGDRFARSDKLKPPSSTAGRRQTYQKQPVQPEPVFDTRVTKNITVAVGQTADLGCRVFYLENRTVSWLRHESMHILAAGLYTYISNIRYLARYNITEDTWFLTISEAQLEDAGLFECQVSTMPVKSYFVRLNVVEKLPSKFDEKQLDAPLQPVAIQRHLDELKGLRGQQQLDAPMKQATVGSQRIHANKQYSAEHKEPWAVMLGDSEVHVKAGSALNLTCLIKYLPSDDDIIRWIHNNQILRYNQLDKKISIFTNKGEISTSTLIIHDLKKYDSGQYKCAPGDIDPVSVIVHVLEGEVTSQLHVNGNWGSLVVPILSLIITISILIILTSVRAIIGLHKRRQNRSVETGGIPTDPS